MIDKENITALADGQIFVFGSNLAGHHAGGAAKTAHEKFGAEMGVGEGLTGQCYALPTLDRKMQQLNDEKLTMAIRKLWKCARENPDKIFLLTRVGTGIAGYDTEYIKMRFKGAPENIIQPNW